MAEEQDEWSVYDTFMDDTDLSEVRGPEIRPEPLIPDRLSPGLVGGVAKTTSMEFAML